MSSVRCPHQLIVRRDLRRIASVELHKERMTLGRSPRCDIVLEHSSVSRQHAALEQRGGEWHVVDQGSTNGVLLHGERVQDAPLRPGHVFEIRPFSLELCGLAPRPEEDSVQLCDTDDLRTVASIAVSTRGTVQRRLEDLYALARLLIRRNESGGFWPAMQVALRHSLAASHCELIGIDDAQRLFPLTFAGPGGPGRAAVGLSRSVIREVSATQRAVLVARVRQDARYAEAASLVAGGTGSVLCAPIVAAGSTRALVYADRSQAEPPFRPEDLEFIAAAVDLAAARVELDDLHASARELARVHGRIAAGREMQELLFPAPIPQPPWGEIAAVNYPAERMSGDIYDVRLDTQGRLVTMLADVSGKGVPAALLTAILQNTLRLALPEMENLEAIVQRLNAVLHTYNALGSFATLILSRWSSGGDHVELANAGHPAPLWLKENGTREAFPVCVGLALGITEAWTGEIREFDARDVVAMVAYTDGANEAKNPRGAAYGVDGLDQALARLGSQTAGRLVEELVRGVRDFCAPAEPGDDVTFLVVTRARAPRP